jgi:hypothetical protein
MHPTNLLQDHLVVLSLNIPMFTRGISILIFILTRYTSPDMIPLMNILPFKETSAAFVLSPSNILLPSSLVILTPYEATPSSFSSL